MFSGTEIFEMIFEICLRTESLPSGIGIFCRKRAVLLRSSPHFLAHPRKAYVFETFRCVAQMVRLRLAPGWWVDIFPGMNGGVRNDLLEEQRFG